MSGTHFGSTQYTIGYGAIDALEQLKGKRVGLVVDDAVISALSLTGRLEELLTDAAEFKVLCHMQTEPTRALLAQPIEACQDFKPDVLVAIGGGSVIDSAKAMWLFYELPHYDWEQACMPFQVEAFPGKCSLIAIPTTSGTGSETTCCSMADKSDAPAMILTPHIRPTQAIIDYDLLASLPQRTIAYSGMDALSHAIGATTINWASELVRQVGIQASVTVIKELPNSYKGDKLARERMAVAATLAGQAIDNSNCGLAHAIDQAGGEFGIPHGLMQAINIPYVLRFQIPQPQYVDIARQVGLQGTDEEVQWALVETIVQMMRDMDIPLCLRDMDIPEKAYLSAIPRYVEETLANPSLNDFCRMPRKEDLERLFYQAYYGSSD